MKTPEKQIKTILKTYEKHLDGDFDAYHNHALRVYYYARTLLLMKENRKLAIAAAFHDLDIWVKGDMDYLKGSAEFAKGYLKENKLSFLPDELEFIISNHHKLTRIKGNIEAEAFRKADLIDLTSGWIKFNIPNSLITEMERKVPRLNFSKIILKKVVTHAFRNPTRPFPMIRL
ncbi:MAG: HD domain-containing protein [Cyclobacteriaceae bacterium]